MRNGALAAEAAAKGILTNAAKAAFAASRKQTPPKRSLQPAQAGFADALSAHPLGAALAASHSRRDGFDLDLCAFWQLGDSDSGARGRLITHLAAGTYCVVWAALFLTIEDSRTFSQYTGPLQALVLLLVCAYALMRAVGSDPPPIWRTSVFWISVGLLLYFGTGLLLAPVSGMLMATQPALVMSAYIAKAGLNVVSYLLVTTGMLCPPRPSSIGAFSLRQAWPS